MSLRIDLPRGFGPSTFSSSLCGTPIDDFRFSNLAVYFASGDLSDSELDTLPGGGMGGINVKKGITLLGEWEMGKSCMFAPMKSIFSAFVLQVYGTLPFPGPEPPTFSITASVGMTFPKKSGVVGAAVSVTFTFGVGELEVEFKGKIAAIVNKEQLEFEMTVTGNMVPPSFKLEADMIGCWTNALGLTGFAICDVGMGIGFNLPPWPPTYFRIQGGFIIGKLKFGMKLEVDMTKPAGLLESAFLGFFKGAKICILDYYLMPIYMAQLVGILPKVKIPDMYSPLCFTQVILKASMAPVTIAKEEFPAGLLLNCTGSVFGRNFGVLVNVGIIMIEAKAWIQNIVFGPISLTGLGCDMKKGTADDGVCLWFKFNLPLSVEMSNRRRLLEATEEELESLQDSAQAAMNQFALFFRFTGSFKALGFFEITALMELSLKGIYIKFVWFMIFTRTTFELSCGETTAAPAGTGTDFRVRFEAYSEGLAAIGKKIMKGIDEFQEKVCQHYHGYKSYSTFMVNTTFLVASTQLATTKSAA